MNELGSPLETFREEARELLEQLEQNLMQLEEHPGDHDSIDGAFRALHTIKGSGNMFDLDDLVGFTHIVEAVFVRVRDGKLPVSRELIDLSLQARDHISRLLIEAESGSRDTATSERSRLLSMAFEAHLGDEALGASGRRSDEQDAAAPKDSEHQPEGECTYRIEFTPAADSFLTGANPLLILNELAELGTILKIGYCEAIPDLKEIEPEHCYLRWVILLTTDHGENEVRDIFIFVEGSAEIKIDVIDEVDPLIGESGYKRLGEILVDRGEIERKDLESAVSSKSYIGEVLVKKGFVSEEQINSALKEQNYVRDIRENRRTVETSTTIKVKVEKLDELVNLVGEFVTMHAGIAMVADRKNDQDFRAAAEQMEGLIRQVRDLSIELHMVPVEILFSGYRRLVRDLSEDLSKQVQLKLEGTETELDKNVIDSLKDPLLHIIRNSIDHGIESPEVRKRKGKPPTGTLRLSAYYSGASVVIQVVDDGAGMDVERIRQKGIERGVIDNSDRYSEQDILQLIFAPGFSTNEEATNVSGRGVGMDVVRRNIEAIGGSIRIQTEKDVGTTLSIRIPLTLAIVDGLLSRIGDSLYLINLSYIVECLDLKDVRTAGNGGDMIDFRGEIVPFLDLRSYFGVEGVAGEHPQLVVVAIEEKKIGLVVDALLDKYQSVIKSLGKIYERVEGISGAIILGDGKPALMLDVDRLVKVTRDEVKK
ncbi:MAG: chemotaxis protein CheA [Spirochaetaceae bacterium]|nr:MAG: chemotaxis protein CheA [Spirochaetaceae bacterium]